MKYEIFNLDLNEVIVGFVYEKHARDFCKYNKNENYMENIVIRCDGVAVSEDEKKYLFTK